MKVGVAGIGHLGSIHTKLWAKNSLVNSVGLYDTDLDKSEKLAREYNCKVFKSLDELIANSDCITIAVPTSLHFDTAMRCIEAGIHCFIEKPITTTYDEATALIEKAKEKNVIIQVGHVERFNPTLLAVKEMELNPRFIEAHRLAQFKPRATDVSVILDLMIHDIDIMLWLIKANVSKIDSNAVSVLTNTPDICNARITFDNGAVANLTASRISAHPMRKMRIFQQNQYISFDFAEQNVEIFKIVESSEDIDSESTPATMLGTLEAGLKNKKIIYQKPLIPKVNAIEEEQISFLKAIKDNEPVAVSADDASKALLIAEKIALQVI